MVRKVIVLLGLVGVLCSAVYADNRTDVNNRSSGYFSEELTEYPEFDDMYLERCSEFASFEEKVAFYRETEWDYIEKDTDSIFVSYREYETNSNKLRITHVIIKDPSQLKVGLSNDTSGGEREKPSDYASRTNAVVVTNGSYFYYDTGQPINICSPAIINHGEVLRSGNSNGSEICLRFDGSFFSPHPMLMMTDQDMLNIGVTDTLGTADPLLIQDGLPQSFPSGTQDRIYPRTVIGMVYLGEYYIITAGYDGSYQGGISNNQARTIFYNLGCTYARSLDGGGSVSLVINGNLKNVSAEGSERAVVDFIAFYE